MNAESTRLGSNRRPDIQGLRAVAVLIVVAFHAGLPLPGGFVGVDVFFVISGYVITAMLMREWTANGRIQFARFYFKRFKRLTPALSVMVAVTVILAVPILSPLGAQQTVAQTAIGAMLLSANFVIARTTGGYFDAPAESNPLLHTWSLSVEEQFYLVFPAVLLAGWLLARRVRTLRQAPVALVALVAFLSFAAAMIGAQLPEVQDQVPTLMTSLVGFYGPLGRAWEFAAGALLVMILRNRSVESKIGAVACGAAGALLLAASLLTISAETPFPGPWTLLPVSSTLLLLLAGQLSRNPVSSLLSTRPMVKVGDWSYSIYLWHWPFIVFASLLWPGSRRVLLVAAVLSLAPALASYYGVEQPIRMLSGLSRGRAARIVAVVLLPTIAISALVLFASSKSYWLPAVQRYSVIQPSEKWEVREGCNDGRPTPTPISECFTNTDGPGTPIYLVGDSHAEHYGDAVSGAGRVLRSPTLVYTQSGCAFYPVFHAEFGKPYEACDDYVTRTLDWLDTAAPGVVLISSMADHYTDAVNIGVGTTPDSITTDPTAKAEVLRAALTSEIQRLSAAGHTVILVQDTPAFPAWDPRTCPLWKMLLSDCSAPDVSQSIMDEQQSAARNVIADVAAETGVGVIDLRDYVCPEQVCSTHRGDLLLYSDSGHLSVAASRDLVGRFAEEIAKAPVP